MKTPETLDNCSFCGKHKDSVAKLIVGSEVSICNECVDLCQTLLKEELPVKAKEITDENVEQVYTNFHCVKIILEPSKRLNEKYKEIEDYLFCLYYFNKTVTQVSNK